MDILTINSFARTVKSLPQKKILVIGDIMLDRFSIGSVKRISPEAPIPVFDFERDSIMLGGCGNVAMNLRGGGQSVFILSAIGDDANGKNVLALLEKNGIDSSLCLIKNGYKTTSKTRLVDKNWQQIVRIDDEQIISLSDKDKDRIIRSLAQRINDFDVVVLSDYNKGFLDYEVCKKVIDLANQRHVRVICDVKGSDPKKYANAFLIKPNFSEFSAMTGVTKKDDSSIASGLIILQSLSHSSNVMITMGGSGIYWLENGLLKKSEVFHANVFNVSGAGDTVNAYLSIAIAFDVPLDLAINFANFAASIKVTKEMTLPVSIDEIIEKSSNYRYVPPLGKIVTSIPELKSALNGKKVVFTNGCFDILHMGHIKLFEEAKAFGDVLVVGLNSDQSVRKLKGPSRPINSQESRAYLLASLSFVDFVIVFDDDTPIDLIKTLEPNVLVKGGDYLENQIVGADFVKSYGGEVKIVSLVPGLSTTNIIFKIQKPNNE